jgi:hypothetical protein
MARLKTAYRNSVETSAPSVPVDDEPPQPSETTRVEFTNGADKTEPSVAIVSADEYPQPDEATLALQKALADLRESERLQRMAQQHAQRPMTREEKLELWKGQGMDDHEAEFLRGHPELIDRPEITQQAAAAALHAGLQRGTHDFNNAVKLNFDTMMGRVEAQATPAATPAFFQPPPSPAPERPDPASVYSAPPSRREAGSREPASPRQVKLSPAEQEVARNLGLSDLDYARQKLKLAQAKLAGDYPERR